MKLFKSIVAVGALMGGRNHTWTVPKSILLKGFRVYPGQHCESSAMMNLLQNQGYEIGEHQIIGAGSALGFVLESSDFPFLGGRNLNLRENFSNTTGIRWQLGEIAEGENGWDHIFSLLEDGTPVVLRVDLRYLPYRYGGKYGSKYMSFGWHMICLAGMDAEKQIAYVTDTEKPVLQEIKLSDLHRARFSDTEVFPPEGQFYWVDKAGLNWAPDWEGIAEYSLMETTRAMTEACSEGPCLIGLDGLSRYPEAIASLDERFPSYLLAPLLSFHYGCIETNGTGGSAFRKMYHDFLEEEGRASGNAFLLEAAERLEPAVASWSELAAGMKALSEEKSVLKDRDGRKAALASLSGRAETLYQQEKKFYEYIGRALILPSE